MLQPASLGDTAGRQAFTEDLKVSSSLLGALQISRKTQELCGLRNTGFQGGSTERWMVLFGLFLILLDASLSTYVQVQHFLPSLPIPFH
jgi:hypothetical protein